MCHQNSLRFYDEIAYDTTFNGLAGGSLRTSHRPTFNLLLLLLLPLLL